MISDQVDDTLVEQIIKGLIGQGTEGMKPVLELLFNAAMKVEREQFLGAGAHERSEERKGYANGYKSKGIQRRKVIFGYESVAKPEFEKRINWGRKEEGDRFTEKLLLYRNRSDKVSLVTEGITKCVRN